MSTDQSGSQKEEYTILTDPASLNLKRITREEYYRDLVFLIARRSTCPRAKVGALLTHFNKIVSTGYNGASRGDDHCEDVGCLRVDYIHGGRCIRTIHAEVNCIALATIHPSRFGETELWVTHHPCVDCIKLCLAYGIKKVNYFIAYSNPDLVLYLKNLKEGLISIEKITYESSSQTPTS